MKLINTIIKTIRNLVLTLLVTIGLSACDALSGEEVARLDIDRVSNKELIIKEANVDLKKGEKVAFWTEMDLEFENDLALVYVVQVWKDSVLQGSFELDALETNPTFMEMKTTIQNKTSWSYTGKMDFLEIESDGNYDFKAIIRSSDNPSLLMHKAVLVLKK